MLVHERCKQAPVVSAYGIDCVVCRTVNQAFTCVLLICLRPGVE